MSQITTKPGYFENLDALRFLSFLAVFLFHSFHTEIASIKEATAYKFIVEDIFGNGNIGVNFFFVLSGFLITYLLIIEKSTYAQIDLKKFWMRRILRIWPLFYFCVLFGFFAFPIIKSWFGQTPEETANILYYLTFLNNFDLITNGLPDASILGVLWSVAIEEQFYLVWPLILFSVPVRYYWIPFTLIITGSLVFRAIYDSTIMHDFHTFSCIGDMTIGAFGAWLVINSKKFNGFIRSLHPVFLVTLYTSFILVFLFRDEVIEESFFARIIERSVIGVMGLLVILEQNYCDRSIVKLSRFKWLGRLGRISYGLYCLHFIGILITITITRKLGWNNRLMEVLVLETIVSLCITVVIATISYRFFEMPFLLLKKKFERVQK